MIPLPRNTVYVESTPAELNSLASALSKWTPTIPLSMVELELASLSWHLLFSNSCSMYFKAKRRMNSLTDLARRSEIMKSHFGWFELICENRLHFISPVSLFGINLQEMFFHSSPSPNPRLLFHHLGIFLLVC